MVRFRLLCGDFLLPNLAPHLENRKTVCMGYTAMTPQGRAGKRRRKGAGNPCRENGTSNLMCSKWAHEVILSGLYPCGQIVYMDTVRVTFDLDLTFCRVSPNFCNTVTLWWVTNTVTHHLEVVNSPLSSCMPHKNGKNFSDRFSIILKVDFRSRAFLNL